MVEKELIKYNKELLDGIYVI